MGSTPHPTDPNYDAERKRQGIKPKKPTTQKPAADKKPAPKTTSK